MEWTHRTPKSGRPFMRSPPRGLVGMDFATTRQHSTKSFVAQGLKKSPTNGAKSYLLMPQI
jgi:hypothetical protein